MVMAADLALALDPVRLALHAGLTPDPWQAAVLRSASGRLLLNCCRQSGKSTISAVLATHTALYDAGALVLLLSPTLRQSGELFRKCLHVYRAAGRPVEAEAETRLTLELENGSRIVSLPGTEGTIRGYSAARLLLVDEASRVDDDTYRAVRPMLAVSAGRLVLMSTPWGARGFFHHEWTEGGDTWERVQVTAADCPRIPSRFLEEERRSMPLWNYRQEYECSFEASQDAAFSPDDIAAAFDPEIAPLFPLTWQGGSPNGCIASPTPDRPAAARA